jgi:intracellular septation protein A
MEEAAAQFSTGLPARVPRFADLLPRARRALGRFALAGLLPIASFYILFRLFGPTAGIAGGMGMSLLALAVQLRRLGRVDPIVVVPMAVILIQGSAALLLDSVQLYLAAPSVENTLWGVVLVGSVVARRPLVRVIARELGLIPSTYASSATVSKAFGQVTLAWGLAAFLKAGVRLWLLFALPLEAFLVVATIFHLALNSAMVAFSFWWPLRAARTSGGGEPGDGSRGR